MNKIISTSDEKEILSIPEDIQNVYKRLEKRIKNAKAIKKAEDSGSYDAVEHQTSSLDLWKS